MVRIPYPIPEPDRSQLMEAGNAAVEALNRDRPALWQKRHSVVEEVLSVIQAKHGVVEPDGPETREEHE